MAVARLKAYEVLGLEEGASYDQIRAAYKRLALLWHPDKHGNSEDATKKFQEISSAYKRLTTEDEEDSIDLSFDEMFDLFTHLVFGGRGYIPGNYYFDDSSDSDDHCCEYHRNQKKNGYRHTSSPSTRDPIKKEKTRVKKPSSEEARTNGDALIREEEREKRQKEKKRERKRKRKQKKREEKEKAKAVNSSHQPSDSEESEESDSEEEDEEEAELNHKNRYQIPSNNQNGSKHPSSNPTHTMPNKKSNSSDKKNNSSEKRQSGNLKNATGSSSKKNTSDHTTQNGSSSGTSSNVKSSKNNKNMERKNQKDGSSGEDEATQGLDLSSAFFAGTVNSVNKKLASQNPKKNKKGGSGKPEEAETGETTENKIQKSRKLAIRGNEMANKGDYRAAIELFSSAITLDPSDHRFFGNRSYCFDQSNQYDKALKDAEKAISLAKDWPKGYFRKGRALAGLKSFNDAEKAYEQVLKLDPGCEEAMQELKRVRVLQLMDMGFTRVQSEIAVIKCGNVQAAAEALLSGALDENSLQDLDEEVYISEEEDILTETIQKAKTDFRNPERLRSIWIGNLSQEANEKQIRDLFGRYGEIESMRRLTEKYCAFINYKDAAMASEAMRSLQGHQFFDSQLLIKFPDHPITDGHLNTIYLKKNTKPSGDAPVQPQQQPPRNKMPPQQSATYSNKQQQSSYPQGVKPGGPVNGNECYFWRTTGCWYGDRCRYQHLPGSKGADLQPWHKGGSQE